MKKTLLSAAILLCSLSSFAQSDCLNMLKVDSYNGKVMTSSKEPVKVLKDANDGIEITVVYGSNLILNIGTANRAVKCVRKNANMDITFTDGIKTSLKHMADLDCRGNFSVFLGEVFQNNDQLKMLETKKVKKLSITYSDTKDGKLVDTVQDFIFTDDQAKLFMQTMTCISYAK